MVRTIQKRVHAGLVTAAVVTTCTVLAPSANALPANEVFTTYYSDLSMTKAVGTSHLFCSGRFTRTGRITAYSESFDTPCN